jgi:hypothetical protein
MTMIHRPAGQPAALCDRARATQAPAPMRLWQGRLVHRATGRGLRTSGAGVAVFGRDSASVIEALLDGRSPVEWAVDLVPMTGAAFPGGEGEGR